MIGLEVPEAELVARLLERGHSGRPDDANPKSLGSASLYTTKKRLLFKATTRRKAST